MTERANPAGPTATLYREMKIEVSLAEFEPHELLAFVDTDLLAEQERTDLEIGLIETDCGRRSVRAVVEKGLVTEIEVAPCGDRTKGSGEVDPDLLELLREATEALGLRSAGTRRLPLPFGDLVANPGLVIETWTCVRICVFGFCFTCCFGENPLGPWIMCS